MRALVIALVLVGSVAGAMVAGCLKRPTFECATTSECDGVGPGATCEADGFCSFTDSGCSSGRRYGDNSGANSGQCVGGGPMPDMATDEPVIPADARECFGSGAYTVCIPGAPMGTVALSGTLDTDTDPNCLAAQPASWTGQPAACFVVGATITVASTTVTGSRPLVLVGTSIEVTGTLDAASHRGGTTGPAANAAGCSAFGADATDSNPVAGGGAGASFKTKGGNGGRADNNNGKPGGTSPNADAANPTALRGGCAGQVGGDAAGAGGVGGSGGGAIYLAATTISLTGRINVSGAGGSAGGNGSGGGGGGSGGMIVLSADTFTLSGAIVANGGSGASGGDDGGNGGVNGNDPNPATANTPAPGGSGVGGKGGDGFAGASPAATGGSGNNRAGGGGGGGGGYIQSNKALTGATVSPTATIVP